MEESDIKYAVLRGFMPIEGIDISKDVHIYIPREYKNKVDKFFERYD